MKSIVLLIISSIMIVGCGADPGIGEDKITRTSGAHFLLREITIDEKTHEYIYYDRGICHYPECKYCKEGVIK